MIYHSKNLPIIEKILFFNELMAYIPIEQNVCINK